MVLPGVLLRWSILVNWCPILTPFHDNLSCQEPASHPFSMPMFASYLNILPERHILLHSWRIIIVSCLCQILTSFTFFFLSVVQIIYKYIILIYNPHILSWYTLYSSYTVKSNPNVSPWFPILLVQILSDPVNIVVSYPNVFPYYILISYPDPAMWTSVLLTMD